MIKPNFFLVGASKAGTTSLAQALAVHPQIFMTEPKEPDFFNAFDKADRVDSEALTQYLRLYETAGDVRILGEASVDYLPSTRAAQYIHDFNPDAKILISLRNPVQRIFSLYEMYVRHGLEQSFEYAVKKDPWLVGQCLYHDSVKRFLDMFPKEQVHYIDFADLKRDWSSTVAGVHQFLAVEAIASEKPVVRNIGGVPKHPLLQVLMNRKLVALGKRIIPKRFHTLADQRIKGLAFAKTETSEQDIQYLSEAFLDDISKLDDLLGSDFSQRWFGSNPQLQSG